MATVGPPEMIVVAVVVLLLFGAKRLPGLARSIGASARELREGLAEGADDSDEEESP